MLLQTRKVCVGQNLCSALCRWELTQGRYRTAALSALRQKKMYENDLDKFSGQRLTLEAQVRTLTSVSAGDYTDAACLLDQCYRISQHEPGTPECHEGRRFRA